ncbi:MAG TPA: hypothetical protein VHA09_04580 [Nitrososphaera sp.]|nr:hypothetical protein [Nitrososphaera sp.]
MAESSNTKEDKIDSSYRINFDGPIPELIDRLKREHRQFESKLAALASVSVLGIGELSEPVMRHVVEEEARVLRVIVHNAK